LLFRGNAYFFRVFQHRYLCSISAYFEAFIVCQGDVKVTRIACHLGGPYGNDLGTQTGERLDTLYRCRSYPEAWVCGAPGRKTFTHRSAALTWAKKREVELEIPAARAQAHHGAPTVAELVRWYIETFETVSKWQRSKQTHLEFLERHIFGERDALTPTVPELVDHVRSRRAEGAGPATVANDLI
jgi:hypothetical protein